MTRIRARLRIASALPALLALVLAPSALCRAQSSDFPFLGVYTDPVDPEVENSGLVVTYVWPQSSAEEIGLEVGDRIIALNDTLIPNRDEFIKQLRWNNVGGTVRFLIQREGKRERLKGKLKSYLKTMDAVQTTVRERMVGKPLPPLPETLWWDVDKKTFAPRENPLDEVRGKVGVVFAFDDCPTCTQKRYRYLANIHFAMIQTRPDAPLAFLGIYQSDNQLLESSKTCLEHAEKMFRQPPTPAFPLGVAHFPKGAPDPKKRIESLWIHNHGLVLLEPDGKVAFVQTTGLPEREFLGALQQLIAKHAGGPGSRAPDEKGGSEADSPSSGGDS